MDLSKVNNIVRIPASLQDKFFKYWLLFLEPFHNLTERELEVATCFIKHRYELSKVIKDEEVLNRVVMGEDTRAKIRKECNMTTQHFQVILGKLRKAKVIVDNKINPKYIPRGISDDSKAFQLLLYFDLNGEHNKQTL